MTNNNESTDYLLLHMCSKGVDNHYSSLYWVIFFFTFAFGNSVRKIMYSNITYGFPYRILYASEIPMYKASYCSCDIRKYYYCGVKQGNCHEGCKKDMQPVAQRD